MGDFGCVRLPLESDQKKKNTEKHPEKRYGAMGVKLGEAINNKYLSP